MEKRKIALASDHAGFILKETIIKVLRGEGYVINDFGSFSEESVDYPDFVHPLANAVEKGEYHLGIVICGSGNGVNMTANKHQGIRSALCWNEETGQLARSHNNANVCALPARFVNEAEAILIVRTFLESEFEGGRHNRRVDKIALKLY